MTKLSPQAFIPSKSFREILQFNKIQSNKIKEGFFFLHTMLHSAPQGCDQRSEQHPELTHSHPQDLK